MYGLLERKMVVSEISLFRTFQRTFSNQIFVEIASVSRDKIRSGLMCILQFSSMSDPSWMVLVLVLDSWGRRSLDIFGPKRIPVDSSQDKYGGVMRCPFSGGTPPVIIHVFSWKCWVIFHPKRASSGASPSVLEALLDGS